jgi:hypothetical protein
LPLSSTSWSCSRLSLASAVTNQFYSVVSYSWLKTKDIWQAFGTLGTVVFAVVISMLSVLFLTTVMGICGSSKRNRCCLVYAVIMMTFWALFFLAVGVSSLIVIPKYFDQNKDSQCQSLCLLSPLPKQLLFKPTTQSAQQPALATSQTFSMALYTQPTVRN